MYLAFVRYTRRLLNSFILQLQVDEQGFLSDSGSDGYIPDEPNQTFYEGTMMQAQRWNITLRGLHAVMNNMKADEGKKEPSEYVSVNKLRNQQKRIGLELELDHEDKGPYEYLGFDGKKSSVLMENCRTEKCVDKITFICQSSHEYVDHKVPESGHGIAIAKILYEVVEKTNSLDTIKSISTDSPNQNTGWKDGSIRKFEELIENEVQHLQCDLHLNEKLLEKVFIEVGKFVFKVCFVRVKVMLLSFIVRYVIKHSFLWIIVEHVTFNS